jgi:hypothetical protein
MSEKRYEMPDSLTHQSQGFDAGKLPDGEQGAPLQQAFAVIESKDPACHLAHIG